MTWKAVLALLAVLGLHARTVTSFDPDWRFLKADATGAETPEFTDAACAP